MAKKYFLADLKDLPAVFSSGNDSPLTHHTSHGKFAICGCEEADYDTHIAPLKSSKPIEDIVDEENQDTESLKSSKEERSKKVKKKNDINYFNILIVIIISFIALILILDTFKVQLSLIIPNIEIVLDNLYLSINDIKLFILDLIK